MKKVEKKKKRVKPIIEPLRFHGFKHRSKIIQSQRLEEVLKMPEMNFRIIVVGPRKTTEEFERELLKLARKYRPKLLVSVFNVKEKRI